MKAKGFIYHIVTPEVWERTLLEGQYKSDSLKKEGFIHFSDEDHVLESAQLHMSDHPKLVVLKVVLKHIKDKVKWEKGRKGKMFPHLYGKLNLESVEDTQTILRQNDGSFTWE